MFFYTLPNFIFCFSTVVSVQIRKQVLWWVNRFPQVAKWQSWNSNSASLYQSIFHRTPVFSLCFTSTYALWMVSSVKLSFWGKLPFARYKPKDFENEHSHDFLRYMLSSLILPDQRMNTVDVVGRGNVQEGRKIVLCKVNTEGGDKFCMI